MLKTGWIKRRHRSDPVVPFSSPSPEPNLWPPRTWILAEREKCRRHKILQCSIWCSHCLHRSGHFVSTLFHLRHITNFALLYIRFSDSPHILVHNLTFPNVNKQMKRKKQLKGCEDGRTLSEIANAHQTWLIASSMLTRFEMKNVLPLFVPS